MSFFRRVIVGYTILFVVFVVIPMSVESGTVKASPPIEIFHVALIAWGLPVGLLILLRWMAFGRKRRPIVIDQP